MSVFPFNFLKCLNAVSVCASNGQYYGQCHLFSGCRNYVGYRGYCFVCRIIETYCPYDFEKIKYGPLKSITLAAEYLEDMIMILIRHWNFGMKNLSINVETFL